MLILTGDIIDRGPDSVGALEFIETHENFYCVLGNHEWMYLKSHEVPELREEYYKPVYGGDWSRDLTEIERQLLADIIRKNFTLALTVNRGEHSIGVIHARSPEDWMLARNNRLSEKPVDQLSVGFQPTRRS